MLEKFIIKAKKRIEKKLFEAIELSQREEYKKIYYADLKIVKLTECEKKIRKKLKNKVLAKLKYLTNDEYRKTKKKARRELYHNNKPKKKKNIKDINYIKEFDNIDYGLNCIVKLSTKSQEEKILTYQEIQQQLTNKKW
tara:strand:+ start:436 stop:852 length:417 start_codon:yes stop_codon:yes gene_type:complete